MKHLRKQNEVEEQKQYDTESYQRNSVFASLKQFDVGFAKDDDYIEVTEWSNGEGFDIDIETNQRQRFQLTWGQYEALKYLIKKIENG